MLHSVKYRIPAIVVKTREEALADGRREALDSVLQDSTLPPDKRTRMYEAVLVRNLNDEEKIGRIVDPVPVEDTYSPDPFVSFHEETPPPFEPPLEPLSIEAAPRKIRTARKKPKSEPEDADDEDSVVGSPIASRLRINRPPPGHFKGKGRLNVVRW